MPWPSFVAPAHPAWSEQSLAGKLLVAEPAPRDLNFSETVVLVLRHDGRGAFGLVINRRAEERTVEDLLALFGEDESADGLTIWLHFGGPVGLGSSLAVHERGFTTPNTDSIGNDLAVSPTVDTLRAIADGGGPRRVRLFFGYAGWSPGQLGGEVASGAWAIVAADTDLVFAANPATVWSRARSRIRLEL